MKLTKTVLAVAIAGIAATPMAASATTTLSGTVQLQFAGSDSEAEHTNVNGEGDFEDGEPRIKPGDIRFGISSSQAMNNGLTAYGNLQVNLDDFSGSAASHGTDSVYVGISGGFGDLRIGEVGNPGEYGQISDLIFDMGTGINQGISYTGSFGGATIGAAYSPAPNQDVFGVGAKFGWNGLSIGAGMENFDEKTNFSASVGFAYAGASIGLGYSAKEDGFAVGTDESAIAATVGYSIAGISLGLTYQGTIEAEASKVRLDAGYDLGGGMGISARVNSTDDASDWRVLFAKAF